MRAPGICRNYRPRAATPEGEVKQIPLGVSYNKKSHKWHATLCWNGGTISLGAFTNEIEAAWAHDHAAIESFGEAAKRDSPREWPPERIREVSVKRSRPARKGKRKR